MMRIVPNMESGAPRGKGLELLDDSTISDLCRYYLEAI